MMTPNASLNLLLAGYLGFDWSDDYPTWEAAVDDYLAREPAGCSGLPAEIATLLASSQTEADVRARIRALGGAYTADWAGGTYREWLEEVARRVEQALAERGDPPGN